MKLLLLVVCLLQIAVLPSVSVRANNSAQTCEDFRGWQEDRDELGGFYFSDGWNVGFVSLLQITAIEGEVQGSFIGIEVTEDHSYDHTNTSVTGIYDESQISLSLYNESPYSLTLSGNWSREKIDVAWPSDTGQLAYAVFYPMTDEAAEQVLDDWPQHLYRDASFELAFATMQRVSVTSRFDVTHPERVYADTAAINLNVPTQDAIDLLLSGWLTSVQFSETGSAGLPNQSNWYEIHVFANHDKANWAANCYREAHFLGESVKIESFSNAAIVYMDYLAEESDETAITTVTAVFGPNLITARIYGDRSTSQHGMNMVRGILEDLAKN